MRSLCNIRGILSIIFVFLLSITGMNAQITGEFIISDTSAYKSFNQAIDSLEAEGLGGMVKFRVMPGTYNERISFGILYTTSEVTQVSFEAYYGDPSQVILTDSCHADSNYVIRFANGSSWINFKDISVIPKGDLYGHAVLAENSVHHISFFNCRFEGIYSNPGNNYGHRSIIYASQAYLEYISFENCTFNKGSTAIYLQGNNNSGGEMQGISIRNNVLSDNGYEGIYLGKVVNPVITGNSIVCHATGLYLSPIHVSATVTNNKIFSRKYGMVLHAGGSFYPDALVANNFIHVDGSVESGIRLTGQLGSFNICYNTLIVDVNTLESYGIDFSNNSSVPRYRVKNNIIACMNNGSPLHIISEEEIIELDYNCYYYPGDFFAYTMDDSWLFSLDDFRDSTGFDSHSYEAYPVFASDTDLHAGTAWFDGKGVPVDGVTTDIDGDVRDANHPDVGADEFNPEAYMVPPLSGTYTIGSGGDFTDLSGAFETLRIKGVSGNTSLEFLDGEYPVRQIIPHISGSSPERIVTLTSHSRNRENVTLYHTGVSQDTNYILHLDGGDYLTIKNLSFRATLDNTHGRSIILHGGSEKLSILDNYFRSSYFENNSANLSHIFSEANFPRDLRIAGNHFDSCAHTIYLQMSYNTRPYPSMITIESNLFSHSGYGGIYLQRSIGPVIRYNQINAGYRGITLTSAMEDIRVLGNTVVLKGGRGISLGSSEATESDRGLIANNFVSVGGTGDCYGLYIVTSDYQEIYHNSVLATGTNLTKSVACLLNSSDHNVLFNNIFSNTGGRYACSFASSIPDSSDYNDLYTTGDVLASIGGSTYPDLSGVQGALGDEANSLSIIPGFTSDTDLHLTGDVLSGLGAPLPKVPYDIDGQPRDPFHPDIGADEYDTTGNYPPEVLHPIPDLSIPEDAGKLALAKLDTVFYDPNLLDVLVYSASGSNPEISITTEDDFLSAEAPADYYGSSTVIVSATDTAGAVARDTFLLTIYNVNDPPLANDDLVVVEQDSAASVLVLDNDSDPDGDGLRISQLIQGDHGSAVVQVGAQYIAYDPDDAYTGEDLVRYVVTDDQGGYDTASVFITVTPMTTGPFVQMMVNLDSVAFGNAIWGDIDHDRDLDIVVCGERTDGTRITSVYSNNEGVFEKTLPALEGVSPRNDRAMAFTDLDYDWYPDLIITGENNAGQIVTRLYINRYNGFKEYETGLPGVTEGSVDWGDFDNDGDPDLLITGKTSALENICKIYRNNGKDLSGDTWNFSPVTTNFWPLKESNARFVDFNLDGYLDVISTGINDNNEVVGYYYTNSEGNYIIGRLGEFCNGSVEFCDFDADDKLEILLTGDTALAGFYPVTRLLRYDDEQPADPFIELEYGLENVFISSADWGDYDNDGDYDLVLSGKNEGLANVTVLYRNKGDSLVNSGIYFPGMAEGTVNWGDYDNDGDLDLLMSGYISTSPHRVTLIYKNNIESGNTAPSPPLSFKTNETEDGLAISWEDGQDAETPAAGLTYNIILRRQKADGYWYDIHAPEHYDGTLKLPQSGNAPDGSVRIVGLESGALYSCRVQSIDAGLKGSEWSEPFLFNVPNEYLEEQEMILAGNSISSAEWVDFDNDRDLDLYLAGEDDTGWFSRVHEVNANEVDSGYTQLGFPSSRVHTRLLDFNNDNVMDFSMYSPKDGLIHIQVSGQVDTAIQTELIEGSHAWGDYDLDGDKDLITTGKTADDEMVSKLYLNENGHLSSYSILIFGAIQGDIEWVDYDNDGDQDIAYCGFNYVAFNLKGVTRIFENRNGGFVKQETDLPGMGRSDMDFGDYDNDGDQDLLICGIGDYYSSTHLYQNQNGTFQKVNIELAPIMDGTCKWVDLDSDGALDIVLSGFKYDGTLPFKYITQMYLNTGNDFTEIFSGTGFDGARVAAGDYDGDNKTDLLIAGKNNRLQSTGILYKNVSENANTRPGSPIIEGMYAYGDSVRLYWANIKLDIETPKNGITYNLRVGTTPGGSEIMSAEAASDGTRKIRAKGNVGSINEFTLHGLTPGENYYYAIQCIDASYQGSDFYTEGIFNSSSAFMIKQAFGFGNAQPLASDWMDYNDDKTMDLLLCLHEAGQYKTVLYPNSNKWLSESPVVISNDLGDRSLLLNDFNKDNRPDFSLSPDAAGGEEVHLFENTGGAFSLLAEPLPGLDYPMSAWGDINNDGTEEFIQMGVDSTNLNTATLIYGNTGGQFSELSNLLPGMFDGTLKFVDLDSDGDLDVFACGKTSIPGNDPEDIQAWFFINQGGAYTMEEAGIPVLLRGDADFGDYDNDRDPDLLYSGYTEFYENKTYLLENIEGAYTVVDSFPRVILGVSRWVDFNNDGDLDILIAGTEKYSDQNADSLLLSHIYQNTGDGFLKVAELETFQVPTVAIGDFDQDQRMDLFIGGYSLKGGAGGFLYRNQTPHQNFLPDKVTNFKAEAEVDQVVFSWDPAYDSESTNWGCSYNLRVGSSPGGNDVVSSLSHADGFRKWVTPGNMQKATSYTLKGLEEGRTYYYSIQTIDNSMGYSGWTTEQEINTPVGIKENPADGELIVYPNPTSGIVKLKYRVTRETDLTIELLNGLGQRLEIIRPGYAMPGEFETELYLKEKGIYFLKLIAGDRTIVRQVVRY